MLRFTSALCLAALVSLSPLHRLMAQDGTPSQPAQPQCPDHVVPTQADLAKPVSPPHEACSYIKQSLPDRRILTATELEAGPTVLDNLRALQKAAKAVHKAEKLSQAGKTAQAVERLEYARKICPGTSWARQAEELLRQWTTTATEDAEEQETFRPGFGSATTVLGQVNNTGMCWLNWMHERCAEKLNPSPVQARVGQIFLIGNERTQHDVILRQIPLCPGQVLDLPMLQRGEQNLARLGIFECSADGSVKPKITILENPKDTGSAFKDIQVEVKETATGSLMLGLGANSDSGLTGSIVINERNFDLFGLPANLADLDNGKAFRGAGQDLRIELNLSALNGVSGSVRLTDPACPTLGLLSAFLGASRPAMTVDFGGISVLGRPITWEHLLFNSWQALTRKPVEEKKLGAAKSSHGKSCLLTCDTLHTTHSNRENPVVSSHESASSSTPAPGNDWSHKQISFRYQQTPLAAVIAEFNDQGIPVALDVPLLQARGFSPQLLVTLTVNELPVMAALDILSRPLGFAPILHSDRIEITAPPVPCKTATVSCPFASVRNSSEPCHSACEVCEKLHKQVVLKRKNRVAGVEEQVTGLLKACYLAMGEGRLSKAADLVREALALDPERVEGDPLLYKLHLLPESKQPKGQSEESEEKPFNPACPRARCDDENLSLRPALPGIDATVVKALDEVLCSNADKVVCQSKMADCPCGKPGVASTSRKTTTCGSCEGLGIDCFGRIWTQVRSCPTDGPAVATTGWTFSTKLYEVVKLKGMKVMLVYTQGVPVFWVQPIGSKVPQVQVHTHAEE